MIKTIAILLMCLAPLKLNDRAYLFEQMRAIQTVDQQKHFKDRQYELCFADKMLKKFDKKTGVWYMSEEERKYYRLYPINGLLWTWEGKPLNTKDQGAMFVMSSWGAIYGVMTIGMTQRDEDMIKHSSFLAGMAVACAGWIESKGGRVTLIDNCSGHYAPNMTHVRQFITEMERFGTVFQDLHIILTDRQDNFKAYQYTTEALKKST